MKIAVAGATGLVGGNVMRVLRERGIETLPISHAGGIDLVSGAGLDAAIAGADRLIDVSDSSAKDEATATAFFTQSAKNLQTAARNSAIDRIVVLSIIGTDRFLHGYRAAKRKQEGAAQEGPVPAVILRSDPFHEYASQVLKWNSKDYVCRVEEMVLQPVSVRNVAEALTDIALAANASSRMLEIAGPQKEFLPDMITRLISALGERYRIETFRQPGADGEAAATDAFIPGPDAMLVGPTFQQWLESLHSSNALP